MRGNDYKADKEMKTDETRRDPNASGIQERASDERLAKKSGTAFRIVALLFAVMSAWWGAKNFMDAARTMSGG
ncbi:hypothetical protein AB4Z27_27680 [Cupriavidus sp. KB_39]|uniref:hypothetical protein n=1 Tax=Cupriavidus sp. KB_39 TaxID=3233036 RepID=UPI003F9215EE